jgi:hypothetical protein
MKRGLLVFAALAAAVLGARAEEKSATRELAAELSGEGRWASAALEYRRLAWAEPEREATWRWMAAWAYANSKDARERARAERQLDAAEDAEDGGEGMVAVAIQALRAELALKTGAYGEARFHFEGLGAGAEDESWARWARRGAATAALRGGDETRARAALEGDAEGLAALSGVAPVRRKRPWVGGVLGLVPGMGYAYSGEWANAVRSLLLNGLFAWAMVETADDDEWALFGVCTFFEITWYSGSIYGGIDAAHRWNARRMDEAERALRGENVLPEPVLVKLPVLELRFK